ncbi:hypothetical protein C7402_10633 [Paraburkholderia unamae]|uniref:Tyr recombinase domain-containing protein n=1 Tax=Paraburkholderia unamae TaxID=219649 RepID=A0ABX5KT53_9BURK|nr:hypothetical protein C7402_10633 [Paraburkholderia unamae]RAR63776.1 hypothetical protein C7401_10533 [Paraburkholderia unamae]
MAHQRFWSIKYVWTVEFPNTKFPLVFLNGSPGFLINQWVAFLLNAGIKQSLFDEMLRAVLGLFEYCLAKFGDRPLSESESVDLVIGFLAAKQKGTDRPEAEMGLGLDWRPVGYKTVQRYISALREFDKFQVTFHGASPLLQVEARLLSNWEKYAEFQRRTKFDLLLHLFPGRKHDKTVVVPVAPDAHGGKKRRDFLSPKSFPLDRFVDLVESTPNPRDKMLFLQLFGLGMRESEPLHLFLADVMGTSPLGEARIRLDDPETGEWRWEDSKGHRHHATRAAYLEKEWKNTVFRASLPDLYCLRPRNKYRGHGGMRVGFKGMTFHDSPGATTEMFGYEAHWIDPRIGIYFRKCLNEYLRENFYGKPKKWPFHPWLYIQLDRNTFGMPLTIPALKKVWDRAIQRLGLEHLSLGPHSLRHLAGYYCATVLRLSKDMTQVLLRHARLTSTEDYYHLSPSEVRRQIIKGVSGVELPETRLTLDVPAHWTS